jgi:hypothetical protein
MGKAKVITKVIKKLTKGKKEKKSQRQAMLDDEIKKVAEDEGISLKEAREIVETNVNEYLGNYDRGGDVVDSNNLLNRRPRKPTRSSYAEKLKKAPKRGSRKPRESERERRSHLTGTVASRFALTPADRYMRKQHPAALQRKGRGIGGAMKKSEVMKKRKSM